MARKSGLRPNTTIRDLKAALAYMPRAVSVEVAAAVAPEITRMAQESYDSGVDVYGVARKAGVNGQPLDLYETGSVRRDMKFTALDTRVSCTIGPNHARFLIGKYRILPIGDRSPVPATWARVIDAATKAAVDRQVRQLPRSA
jgi:hypothetical protein